MHKHVGHNVIKFDQLQQDEAELLRLMCEPLWSFGVKYDLMRRISNGTHSAESLANAIGHPAGVLDGPWQVFRDAKNLADLIKVIGIWLNKLVLSNRVDTAITWIPLTFEGHS